MSPEEFVERFKDRCFYHFTDTRNLESIRKHGGLLRYAELQRRKIAISAPGGNEWSHDADAIKGLDKYVHLCFMNQHPMEFVAMNKGHIANVRYLEISPKVLAFDDILVTLDVSNKRGVDPITWKDACNVLDFEVIYEKTDWKNSAIKERLKAARRCELLIPADIPLTLLRGI